MKKPNIAVVVPTIRDIVPFLLGWKDLFIKHDVRLVIVQDGEKPEVFEWPVSGPETFTPKKYQAKTILENDADLIPNFTDACRNLGFAYVARCLPETDIIITLDDDTLPFGDTIQDHIDALSSKVPVSWMNTTIGGQYMRGFPYNIRGEAPVVLSHGIWLGVPDLDAPTQLQGIQTPKFYHGPIPKGVFFPMCGMNIAFTRETLPFMYFAPMKGDIQRFADIWCGIEAKKDIDRTGGAVVSGLAAVRHERASNVYKNLRQEARGIEMNDHYPTDPYFQEFFQKRRRFAAIIRKWQKK